MSSANLVCLC